MEICELKPHGPNHKRPDKCTQRKRTYKTNRKAKTKLHTYIPLPYAFNVENTVQLMKDLRAIPYDRNMRFAFIDLTNMYSNVPTNELMAIVEYICENNSVERGTASDIMKIA
jgi:hypothetical protein